MQELINMMNEMQKIGLLKSWALGGGIAAKYYCNPPVTKDIDFFITLDDMSIMAMQPIADYLIDRGGKYHKHMISFNGTIVDIIPSDDPLIVEAIKLAITGNIEGIKMRVIPADYLAAIATKVGRPKDIERVGMLYRAWLLTSNFFALLSIHRINSYKIESEFKKGR